jgi:hypothetical protein
MRIRQLRTDEGAVLLALWNAADATPSPTALWMISNARWATTGSPVLSRRPTASSWARSSPLSMDGAATSTASRSARSTDDAGSLDGLSTLRTARSLDGVFAALPLSSKEITRGLSRSGAPSATRTTRRWRDLFGTCRRGVSPHNWPVRRTDARSLRSLSRRPLNGYIVRQTRHMERMAEQRYDRIGAGYADRRRPDPCHS